MLTQLLSRRANSYTVDLRLEERVQVLADSPQACCWDLKGDRLLFARDVWRYKVIAGTDEVWDPGVVDTEIAALAAADLPMSSAAQGTTLVRLDRIATRDLPIESPPPPGSLRILEALAADPATGNWIVYSHRDDVGPPYRTDLQVFAPNGGILSEGSWLQPDDGTPRWSVPHAIVQDGWIYAVERNLVHQPTVGPAPGQVVKRGVGTAGSLIWSWDPGDRYAYPHSLSVAGGAVYVVATKLFEPATPAAYQQSLLAILDSATLSPAGPAFAITFGLDDVLPDDGTNYHLGEWSSAGLPNLGGLCLLESLGDDGAVFVASGITPAADYNPRDPAVALFRFRFAPPGVHLGDLGEPMPTPMSRTPHGLAGCSGSLLPLLRDL